MQKTASDFEKDGIRLLGRKTMPVERWLDVPDNPVQRDTEHRAKRAKHLHKLAPAHLTVAMAKLEDNGKVWKVDGHTRAFVWLNTLTGNGAEPVCDKVPEKVFVDVYSVKNEKAAKRLFDTYDQTASVKNASDIVFGAIRDQNLHFETPWLAHGHFKYTVQSATQILRPKLMTRPSGRSGITGVDVRDLVNLWAPELLALDKIHPKRNPWFGVATMVPALWSLALYRESDNTLEFWHRLNQDEGNKRGKNKDFVYLASEYILQAKEEGKFAANAIVPYAREIMTYFLRWQKSSGRMVAHGRTMSDADWENIRHMVADKKGLAKRLGW